MEDNKDIKKCIHLKVSSTGETVPPILVKVLNIFLNFHKYEILLHFFVFFSFQLTTNGTSHFYTPIPGGFPPPGAGGQGPGPYQVGPHGHMAPPPQPGTPQPQQQSSANSSQQQQHSPASHSANHSPSPPNNSYHKDERTQRQHTKLLRKLDKQRK